MRILLPTLLGLLFSFSAFGQIKHFVFQLNGTVAQGIPFGNVDQVKKGQALSVNYGGRTRYFALYEKMANLLFALQAESQVVLHFYDDDKTMARALLEAMPLAGDLKMDVIVSDGVSKIFSTEDLEDGELNLSKISGDEEVYFVSSRDSDSALVPEEKFIKVGSEIFYFEDHDKALAEEASLRANGSDWADRYFVDKDLWVQSMNKSFMLYSLIIPNLSGGAGFQERLTNSKRLPSTDLVTLGRKMGEYDFLKYRVGFNLLGNDLRGCSKIENLGGKIVEYFDIEECAGLMDIKARYHQNHRGDFVCALESATGEKVDDVTLGSCLKLKQYRPRMSYDKSVCSAFALNGVKLTDLAYNECDGIEVYIASADGKGYHFGKYHDDFEALSKEDIAERLADVPERSDFLKLWFPFDHDDTVGFEWRDCRDPKYSNHPVHEKNGVLMEECEGDTFYSWGPQIKLDNIRKWMGDGDWEESFRPLFMARTPIGSFGYGPVSLRIKLRDDLVWSRSARAHDSCNSVDRDGKMNTAFYRTMSMYGSHLLDIIICSPHTVHSWSHGTKEHYDEIIKDYWWTLQSKARENLYEMYINNYNRLLTHSSVDGKDFRISTLNSYILIHLEKALNGEGEIFVNPAFRDGFYREDHFSTEYPIYFNER